jgi:hypothetical protein
MGLPSGVLFCQLMPGNNMVVAGAMSAWKERRTKGTGLFDTYYAFAGGAGPGSPPAAAVACRILVYLLARVENVL